MPRGIFPTNADVQQQNATKFTTAGTSTAFTGSVSPALTALTSGIVLFATAHTAAGASPTLAVNGLSALPLKYYDANAALQPVNGLKMPSGWKFRVYCDGTNWVMLDVPPSAVALTGFKNGLIMSPPGGSATMPISLGSATDSTGVDTMVLSSGISKTTASWAVGTGVGGLDTGTIANNTWYHFYLIKRTDTGVVDMVFSTNATLPTLPTSYTEYRRIGSDKTDGSGNWVKMSQVGNMFLWDVAVKDVDVTNPGTSAVLRTLSTPLGINTVAILSCGTLPVANNFGLAVSSPDVSDQQAQAPATSAVTGFSSVSGLGAGWTFSQEQVRTNTSSQIRTRINASGAGDGVCIITRGWIDPVESYGSGVDISLRADLASATGSTLSSFKINTATSAIRSVYSKLLEIEVSITDFGAVGDWNGTTGTNNATAIQNAVDYVYAIAGKGIVKVPRTPVSGALGFYTASPIVLYSGITFQGEGIQASAIYKGTASVTPASLTASMVCLGGASIGDGSGDVNSILFITDAIRAENVVVQNMTLSASAGNAVTSLVRFGIAGVGASKSKFHNLKIANVNSASFVMPVFFASEITEVESFQTGRGPCIENGTSLTITHNYSHRPHEVGYYLRDLKYSTVHSNAIDSLNSAFVCPEYSDRSIHSKGYVFDACQNVSAFANGMEDCWVSQVIADSCSNCNLDNFHIISPQSDYTGANDVAIMSVLQLGHNVSYTNFKVRREGVTALSGAANPAKHHDLFVSVASENQGFIFKDNWLGNNTFDAPSSIYGNNVPVYIDPKFQGSQAFGDFTPSLTLTGGSISAITYGARNKGRWSVVNGWMHVDITLHVSSITYTGSPAYATINFNTLTLKNQATESAKLLIDYSENVTWASTESFWFSIDSTFGSGLARNRTDSVQLNAVTGFPSGSTNVVLHCSGDVYIGDKANIV
jgi:hypothetical protein